MQKPSTPPAALSAALAGPPPRELSAGQRDAQATECLRVGAAERGLLLALAVKLAGSAEAGMDLYQQSLLDCHDAIQRLGFAGSNYKFYLYQAIKWLAVEHQRAAARLSPLDTAAVYDTTPPPAPEVDALAGLAAQVEAELVARFPAADVSAFRLHVAGHNYREIEAAMGPGYELSWARRKILKMKTALRQTFGQAWANLDSE